MLKLTKLSSTSRSYNNNVPKLNKASLLRMKNKFAAKKLMTSKKQKNCNENSSLNNLSNDKENLMDAFIATQEDLLMYISDAVQDDSIKTHTPPKKQKTCNIDPSINNLTNDNEKLMYTVTRKDGDDTKNHLSHTNMKKCNIIPSIDKESILDTSNTTQHMDASDVNMEVSLMETFTVIQSDPSKEEKCSDNSSLNILQNDTKELLETTTTTTKVNATKNQLLPEKPKKVNVNKSSDKEKLLTPAACEGDAHSLDTKGKKQSEVSITSEKEKITDNLKAIQEDICRDNKIPKKQKKISRNSSINNIINNREKLKDFTQATPEDTSRDQRAGKKNKESNEDSPVKNTSIGKNKQLDTSNDHTPPKKQKTCSENSSLNILSNEKKKLLQTSRIKNVKPKISLTKKKQKKCDKVPSTNTVSNSREKLDTCETTVEDVNNTLSPAKKAKKT